jgi:signal transduction histidine kinase
VVRLLRADGGPGEPDAPQPDLADLDDLVAGYRAAGLDVEWTMAGEPDGVEPTAALAVYRALQEALANASRHGDGAVVVDLRIDDGQVTLRVDNPLPDAPPREPAPGRALGSGLLGMRERIVSAGGTLEAGPRGRRWAVLARVPATGAAS